jgi:hypothetical protein
MPETGSTGVDIDQRRRLVRAVLALHPRGFAAELGVEVTNNPSALLQLLFLSVLTAGRVPPETSMKVVAGLRKAGFERAGQFAEADVQPLAKVLRDAGLGGRASRLASQLRDLANAVRTRYGGDLRRLRSAGHRDPGQVRRLLGELPGVRPAAVGVFARDAQVIWPELAFTVDRPALTAARELGLARGRADLAELVAGREAERAAWVVGALALVQQQDDYDEVRRRAASPARLRGR